MSICSISDQIKTTKKTLEELLIILTNEEGHLLYDALTRVPKIPQYMGQNIKKVNFSEKDKKIALQKNVYVVNQTIRNVVRLSLKLLLGICYTSNDLERNRKLMSNYCFCLYKIAMMEKNRKQDAHGKEQEGKEAQKYLEEAIRLDPNNKRVNTEKFNLSSKKKLCKMIYHWAIYKGFWETINRNVIAKKPAMESETLLERMGEIRDELNDLATFSPMANPITLRCGHNMCLNSEKKLEKTGIKVKIGTSSDGNNTFTTRLHKVCTSKCIDSTNPFTFQKNPELMHVIEKILTLEKYSFGVTEHDSIFADMEIARGNYQAGEKQFKQIVENDNDELSKQEARAKLVEFYEDQGENFKARVQKFKNWGSATKFNPFNWKALKRKAE